MSRHSRPILQSNWNAVSHQIWRKCHISVDSGDLNQAPRKQSAVCSTCIVPAPPVNCQFIGMIKNILSTPHLRLLYQSLIEPYLMYNCMVWATPDRSTLLEVLHRLQKRAARITVYAKHRDHSKPIFSKLNILSIYDLSYSDSPLCLQVLEFPFT